MENWKNESNNLLEKLMKHYGVSSLNIPLFQLQEFIYMGNSLQNAKMKAIGRFKESNIIIEKNDKLSGCFDGCRMHCFYRTFIPNELSYQFESLLKKYNILYEKYIFNTNICYACDVVNLELKDLNNINNYAYNKHSLKENIIQKVSKKLTEKIL